MGNPTQAVGSKTPTPGETYQEDPAAQFSPEESTPNAQSDPEFFLKREALRILLTKPPQQKPDIEESDDTAQRLRERRYQQFMSANPGVIDRLGEGLGLAHEWMKANDGYKYMMIGLVVLAGLNLEGDRSAEDKLVDGLYKIGKTVRSEVDDCTESFFDNWFDEDSPVGINPGSFTGEDKTPSISWMFEQDIDLEGKSYEVKVSHSGWIQVNGRLWKLSDADTNRNATITVENLSYNPQSGLNFKVKGSKYLVFSQEATKNLDLVQSAQLLERLATSEEDPTTEQIRAAGIRLTKGPESARG